MGPPKIISLTNLLDFSKKGATASVRIFESPFGSEELYLHFNTLQTFFEVKNFGLFDE